MTTSPIWLYLRAPFAAYRWLQAGVYRATSPTIPPSAAWGLLLNCAAIETRGSVNEASTPIRPDAPTLRVAVGLVHPTGVGTLYQQLHTYPVGNSGKERKEAAHGAKYWIAPAKREILIDLEAVIGASGPPEVLGRIRAGLAGTLEGVRYGLPFAGDNSFLFDRLELVDAPPPAHWYTRVDEEQGPRDGSTRVTVSIDRADASRTRVSLVAPLAEARALPPENAWYWVPREPD